MSIQNLDQLPDSLKECLTFGHSNRAVSSRCAGTYSHEFKYGKRPENLPLELFVERKGSWFELVKTEEGIEFHANCCVWMVVESVEEYSNGGWILQGNTSKRVGGSPATPIFIYPFLYKDESEDLVWTGSCWLLKSDGEALDLVS